MTSDSVPERAPKIDVPANRCIQRHRRCLECRPRTQDARRRGQRLLRRQAGAEGRLDQHSRGPRHRLHRSVGLRQIDVPALPQPDERHHPVGARHWPDRARRRGHHRAPTWTSSSCAPASAWCSRSPIRSPSRSSRTSPTARASTAWRGRRPSWTESSRSSLKRAGLWDEVKDRLQESGTALSGGQQQRLCIARAIAVDPEVILMDEPCSALDPIATAKIEELIHELRGRYAIAIVTHNMQQAARVSQRTAFFHLGELVEYGKTSGDLHQSARAAHPGLYHRPLRLIGAQECSTPADIRSRRSTKTSTGCARSSARWAASPSMRSARRCAA